MNPIYAALIIVSSVLAFLILFALVTSFVCYRMCFYNPDRNKKNDPRYYNKSLVPPSIIGYTEELLAKLESEKYVPVETKSYDGLTLRGNYYVFDENAPTMIFFNGYKSCLYSDGCGGFQEMKKNGFNVLLVHQRAHGISDGNTITFGIKERYDVLSWIDFIKKNYGEDTPIGIGGVSMGSATVALASALDLPDNVRCIYCDCGYSSVTDEIKLTIRKMKLPAWFFYPFVWLGAFLFAHVRLKDGEVAEALRKNKLPIVFIHGEADQVVPFEMGKANYENSGGDKSFYAFPGATHGISYLYDTERYSKAITEFLKKVNFGKK